MELHGRADDRFQMDGTTFGWDFVAGENEKGKEEEPSRNERRARVREYGRRWKLEGRDGCSQISETRK